MQHEKPMRCLAPTRIIIHYRRVHRRHHWWWRWMRGEKKKMPDQTVSIPLGPNTATVKVLDQNGNDITTTCTITAVSSDATVVSVGTATTPNQIPLSALKEGGSCTVTYTAVNSAGQIVETDTLNVSVTAPASITVSYASTVVTPPPAPAPTSATPAPATS